MQRDAYVLRHYGTFENPNYANARFERKSEILDQLWAIDDTGGPDIRGGTGRFYKGGGGGGKGVVGAVVGIVATVISAGTLAPMLAGTMFAEGTMGFAIATGAIAGATGGLAQGLVTGQNIGQSMLRGAGMGAIGGGIGYAASGPASAGVANGATGATTTAPVTADVAAAPVAGGEATGLGSLPSSVNGADTAFGQSGTNFSSLDATSGANAAGANTSIADSLGAQAGAPATQQAGLIPNNAQPGDPGYGWQYQQNGMVTSPDGTQYNPSQSTMLNRSGQLTGPGGAQMTWQDKLGNVADAAGAKAQDVFSAEGMKKAGLQLGTQALAGAIAPGPDMSQMNSYLNDMKGMQQQAQEFNMNMANKKAAIGDSMAQTADNYNPEYYALQSQTQSKNRRASQWADTESQLRAQGYDQNYINAMKNKYDVDSSQVAGSAYDSGWQTGQNARQSAYQAAGGMYTGVSSPTAGLSGDYMSLYKQKQDSINGIANTVSKATGQEPDSMK